MGMEGQSAVEALLVEVVGVVVVVVVGMAVALVLVVFTQLVQVLEQVLEQVQEAQAMAVVGEGARGVLQQRWAVVNLLI